MNEMLEVVIKIPKDTFDAIGILQDFVDNKHQIDGYQIKGNSTIGTMIKAIANGTVLPKGHGDLKDVAEIERLWQKGDYDSLASAVIFAPTVIEADKEVEDDD